MAAFVAPMVGLFAAQTSLSRVTTLHSPVSFATGISDTDINIKANFATGGHADLAICTDLTWKCAVIAQ